ncbi:putative hexosyltransferase [Jatrophihabitans fulvus]
MTSGGRTAAVALAGFVAACLAVVAGGRAFTGTSVPPTRWLGLIPERGWRAGDSPVWGVLLWAGIVGLSLAWVAMLRLRPPLRTAWTLAAAWAAPFVVGPPLVSKDVYAYAAQALMLRRGLDVYTDSPKALTGGGDAARALAAVDPRWQSSESPYGPATTLLLRAIGAVTGDPTVAVVLLRAVAVLSVAALAVVATRLASTRTADTVVLIALNPLVLVHALSAAHVEALMCALLVASLVVAQRRRYEVAVALACLAGLVKAPAFLAVGPIVLWHVLGTPLPARDRVRRLAVDAAIALVTVVVVSTVTPHGWGWIGNLSTPTQGDPTSSITGNLRLGTVGQALGALAALAIVAYLLTTFRRRTLAATTGYGLLAVAFLLPVTYPWYALWGVVCVLPSATGRVRTALVALCVAKASFSIPGAPGWLTGVLSMSVVVAAAAWVVFSYRRTVSAPA